MASLEIKYTHSPYSELSSVDQRLVDNAKEAMDGAHAPYSNFHVGCAVMLGNDEVVIGNNQENAAYPSGLCAERVALFAAKSRLTEDIYALAITARNAKGHPADAFACGSCRQVMLEYASQQSAPFKVIMGDHNGKFIVIEDMKQLLPFSFDFNALEE